MNEKMLSIAHNDEKLIVVQNKVSSAIETALNPEIPMDEAFYSITKGDNHIFTITKHDGTTYSFEWGGHGTTLISDSMYVKKQRVLNFLQEELVLIGLVSEPKSVRMFESYVDCCKGQMYCVRVDGSKGDCDCRFLPYREAIEFYDTVKERYHLI